jgi:hypothetical protein
MKKRQRKERERGSRLGHGRSKTAAVAFLNALEADERDIPI